MIGFGCGVAEVVLLKYLKKQPDAEILPGQLSIVVYLNISGYESYKLVTLIMLAVISPANGCEAVFLQAFAISKLNRRYPLTGLSIFNSIFDYEITLHLAIINNKALGVYML